jgi:hypothetical protein
MTTHCLVDLPWTGRLAAGEVCSSPGTTLPSCVQVFCSATGYLRPGEGRVVFQGVARIPLVAALLKAGYAVELGPRCILIEE